MTTDRSYRKALSPDDALAELQRCAETQFDPRVVDALTALSARSAPRPLDRAA
jgi:HD-GYP domain-containing protein (c-di-GMP phosphodiesterase class II)